MMQNYFHKSCNKTVKKFYQDFDLLPVELKELIWYNSASPDFDDLRAAWDLAEKNGSFEKLYKILNVFEEDRKQDKIKLAAEKKAQRQLDRQNKRMRKYRERANRIDIYHIKAVERDPKHSRLVEKVSSEEAMKRLSGRKETKEIKSGAPFVRVYAGSVKEVEIEEKEIKYFDFGNTPQTITKMMHNSGGKK